MSIEEMHEAFETRFGTLNQDKVFFSSEISYYLNLAQRQLFEELLPDFDKDDRIKMILYKLLKKSPIIEVAQSISFYPGVKTYVAEVPSDFKIAKGELAKIRNSNGDEDTIRVKSISNNYFNLNVENPFKKPSDKLAWRLDLPEPTIINEEEPVPTPEV